MLKMVHFKLSPNEEARLLKEERERRRKLRIQQVHINLEFSLAFLCVFLSINHIAIKCRQHLLAGRIENLMFFLLL
jgi:hypothetical protein